jgi:hypothetical protein
MTIIYSSRTFTKEELENLSDREFYTEFKKGTIECLMEANKKLWAKEISLEEYNNILQAMLSAYMLAHTKLVNLEE